MLIAALVALGIAIGPGTAHASTTGLFRPAENSLGNSECSVSGWPNGIIWCGTGIGANFPNGTQEVFGIGLNGAMWTDYGTESHPSGWKSLGGSCVRAYVTGLASDGDYGLSLFCIGIDLNWYVNTRDFGVSGGWSGWSDTGVASYNVHDLGPGILFSNGTTQ
jgi:hypothetical protein